MSLGSLRRLNKANPDCIIRTQKLYYYPQMPSWAPFLFLVSLLIFAAVSLGEPKVGEGGDCLLLLLAVTLDWITEVVNIAKARLGCLRHLGPLHFLCLSSLCS